MNAKLWATATLRRTYARKRLDEALAHLGYPESIFCGDDGVTPCIEHWLVASRRDVYARMLEPIDGPPVKLYAIDECIGSANGTARLALKRKARPCTVRMAEALAHRDAVLESHGLTMAVFDRLPWSNQARDEMLWTLRQFAPRGERICGRLLARITVGVDRWRSIYGALRRHADKLANRKAAA